MIDPQKPDFSNTPASPGRASFGYIPEDASAEPYVTILTPFYNAGSVFCDTAQSVLRQSFQQWEWLIVNDGSHDEGALALLAEYRQRDPRIRVIDHPANLGLSAARNTGFREARTQYVVLLDADDLLEAAAIEKWVWSLESYSEFSFVKGYAIGFDAQTYLWEHGFHSKEAFLEENCVDPTCMVRKAVHAAVGGFDETIRGGLEDWDFWLRCAHSGYWGTTIPEYLDWYRRRATHTDRWSNWDGGQQQKLFQAELRRKYPKLWSEGFPNIQPRYHIAYDTVPNDLPFDNRLAKQRPRALMILPWLTTGGADKFNLDLLKRLVEQHGYEVTIATTLLGDHSWMPVFSNYTPDIFALHNFLRTVDFPRFLRYLIQSRRIDTVLISNSYLGYQLLPYLRAHCPDITFIDYIHMEEENWKNGGYPRASLIHAEQLDLTVVSSEHLKQWMVARGGDQDRIQVCTTNIDTDDWDPERYDRLELRQELRIAADESVILYAGRICAQKQPQVFAKVILELVRQGHRFVALVAGDGPDLNWLKQFIRTHRLGCVRLLGSVNNQRIRELMAISDIFFLPSDSEGISLAIYEAMAMGVVPVGADVGGQRELVTPDCGFLMQHDASEAAAYVASLARLLSNQYLRKSMSQAARRRVRDSFRLDQMSQRMVDLMAHAAELARLQPRPSVPPGLGLEIANQVIEQTRLEWVADQLWHERQALLGANPTNENLGRYIVLRAMRRAKLILRPVYRWAIRHNMHWLAPIRDRVYRTLTRMFHQQAW